MQESDLPSEGPSRAVTDRDAGSAIVRAALTVFFAPAKTAQRTAGLSLWSAYVLHLMTIVMVVILCYCLVGWEAAGPGASCGLVFDATNDLVANLFVHVSRHPLEYCGAFLLAFLGIEAGYVLLAMVCMSWGAADEPLRDTRRITLQRAWLHSPMVFWLALVAGSSLVKLDHLQREASQRVEERMRDLMPRSRSSSQQGRDWLEAWQQQPVLARNSEELSGICCLLCGAWWLWSLLRFIGTPRPVAPIAWPPTCELCGYNLTGIGIEARCPECGEAAALSLGSDGRPGVDWHRRRSIGRWRAWWRTAVASLRSPSTLGRTLRQTDAGMDHRSFLAASLPIAFLIGWVGLIALYLAVTRHSPMEHDPEVVWAEGPLVGVIMATLLSVLALVAARVVGWYVYHRQKRNILSGLIQATCYLAGYLLVMEAACFTILVICFLTFDRVAAMFPGLTYSSRRVLILAMWGGPNLLFFVGYLFLVHRAAKGLRYANR